MKKPATKIVAEGGWFMFRIGLVFCLLVSTVSCFGSIGVKVTPNSWNVGTGGAGTWVSPSFNVQNIGTDPAKVKIRATNTQAWTLGTSPALNTFSMQWGTEPNWNGILTADSNMLPSLAAGSSYTFNLRYQSPTSIEPITLDETQFSTITVSVVSPEIGIWEFQIVDGM